MILSLLALMGSTAGAADLNEEGGVDSSFEANEACVPTDTGTTSGLTVGLGPTVGAFADIGPDVTLGQGVILT
ncbi:MAG: hypothetical protein ACJA00_004537, partial [Myxococcota bacterium]